MITSGERCTLGHWAEYRTFLSNFQMDRDFWLDCGLFCVSVTQEVKCSKKTPHLFPDTATMIIRCINCLDFSQFLLASLTCSQQRCLLIIITSWDHQSCLGVWMPWGTGSSEDLHPWVLWYSDWFLPHPNNCKCRHAEQQEYLQW